MSTLLFSVIDRISRLKNQQGYRSHLNNTVNELFFFSLFKKFLAVLRGMWDLSSPTRDGTHAPCSGSAES